MKNGDQNLLQESKREGESSLLSDLGGSNTARPRDKGGLRLGHSTVLARNQEWQRPTGRLARPARSNQNLLGSPYVPSPLARSPEAVSALQARKRRGFPSPVRHSG